MFCPNCGRKIESPAKFCPSCGFRLQQMAETREEKKIESGQPAAGQTVNPYMNQNVRTWPGAGAPQNTQQNNSERVTDASYRDVYNGQAYDDAPQAVKESEFSFDPKFLRFLLKVHVSINQRRVSIVTHDELLGFFPGGRHEQTIPLSNISSVELTTGYNWKQFFIGLFVMFLSFVVFGFAGDGGAGVALIGVIMLLAGFIAMLSSLDTSLVFQRSGNDFIVPVAWYAKGQAKRLKNTIDQALEYEVSKTDTNRNTDRIISAMHQMNGR